MKTPTRDQLKKLFKRVKHLHLPANLESVNFDTLTYFSWLDQSEMCLFVIYELRTTLAGLKLDIIRPPAGTLRLGFCEFCHKHRKQNNVFFVAAETKKRPKGVEYRSRGTWMCADFKHCNEDLKNDSRINEFFVRMLEEE